MFGSNKDKIVVLCQGFHWYGKKVGKLWSFWVSVEKMKMELLMVVGFSLFGYPDATLFLVF